MANRNGISRFGIFQEVVYHWTQLVVKLKSLNLLMEKKNL